VILICAWLVWSRLRVIIPLADRSMPSVIAALDVDTTKPSEAAFLALGDGAKLYPLEAGAAGVRRLETRMAEAVALAGCRRCGAQPAPKQNAPVENSSQQN